MYLSKQQVEATAHMSSREAAKVLGVGKTSVNKYRREYYGATEPIVLPDAKILTLDIESKPGIWYSWGPRADWLPAGMMIDGGGMLCFAAKWLGSDEVMFYRGEQAVYEAHALLSEADLVITYNGDRYDLKRLNNEFLKRGMAPPSPYRSVDLFKTNRAQFDLPYKKLDVIAQFVDIGGKMKHQGFDLWVGCMNDDPEAWVIMEDYNKQDVVLTEKLYIKLLPWLKNVPHMGMFTTDGGDCPYCASDDLTNSGQTHTFVQTYSLYKCNNCEGWSRGNKPHANPLATRRA